MRDYRGLVAVGAEAAVVLDPSDEESAGLALNAALRLPTFEVDGMTLYRRLTFIAREGRIVKAFYPVFPPDSDSAAALGWLRGHPFS